jgi:uncharacterized membrane protein YphA (DoxX/SURF4 family)
MNIVLWILQVLLGLAFIAAGANKVIRGQKSADRKGMEWVTAVPAPLLTFIGVCEVLGGLGLILPAATGIWPWLTPLAAALLTVVMVLAAGFHARRSERQNLTGNLIIGALTLLLTLGRIFVVPL